jgi:hypothetical protein
LTAPASWSTARASRSITARTPTRSPPCREDALHGALLPLAGSPAMPRDALEPLAAEATSVRRRAHQSHRAGMSRDVTNRDMVARSLAAVWHPCTQMKAHERFPLVPVAHAAGAWLTDFDGKRYLDGVSSWWVNPLRPPPSRDQRRPGRPAGQARARHARGLHARAGGGAGRAPRPAWRPGASVMRSSLPMAHRPRRSHSRWRSTTGPTAAVPARTAS